MRMLKATVLACLMASPALAIGIDITVADADGEKGVISIELFEDTAPAHVDRIVRLAKEGAYDGVVFHRVISGFMAQTGDVEFGDQTSDDFSMNRAGMGGSELDDLKAEFSKELSFERGVLGMARSRSPDSANSQFFITFQPARHLDGQYTIFGKVTDGLDVLDAIKLGKGPNGAVLGAPDFMKSVVVTD